jgi:hypothetical protein
MQRHVDARANSEERTSSGLSTMWSVEAEEGKLAFLTYQ